MAELPLVLEGARIELRTLEPTFENAKMIFDIVVVNREYVLEWLPWASITDKPEDSFNFLLKIQRNRKDNTEYGFGIFLDNKYIGNISIFDVSEEKKSGEIGYWLVKDANGKGYMTEAIKLIEDAFFQSFGNRIQIKCDTRNAASSNVPKRMNYHIDGELRQDNIDKDGNLRNTLIYSKLKSEWQKA